MFPGFTYDLDPTLARYLMSIGTAVTAPSHGPALVIPLGSEDDFNKALGGISVTQIVEAADTRKRKRSAGRKKR
jgi:hypothetical protein